MDHPSFRVDRRAIQYPPHSRFLTRRFEFRPLAFSVIPRTFFASTARVSSKSVHYRILHPTISIVFSSR